MGLEVYLKCEKLLNDFFSDVNFCGGNCTSLKDNIGCCGANFYNHTGLCSKKELFLLFEERDIIYGSLPTKKGECQYHNINGCVLKTHKAPFCLAYICDDFKTFLKNEYGFDYDSLNVDIILREAIINKLDSCDFDDFSKKIKDFIKK